jgi:hypothetical protein
MLNKELLELNLMSEVMRIMMTMMMKMKMLVKNSMMREVMMLLGGLELSVR